MATRKALDSKEWNEVRTAAEELKGLGGDAAKAIRRAIKEASEPGPAPEPDDRAAAILAGLEWLTTPEAKRSTRPPELTPLSKAETGAVRLTFEALDMGIEIELTLLKEISAEEQLQIPTDRKRGVLRSPLPPILEILKKSRHSLDSERVRGEFFIWARGCSEKEARKLIRILRGTSNPKRERLAENLRERVRGLMEREMTQAEAIRIVASGAASPLPANLRGYREILLETFRETFREMNADLSLLPLNPLWPLPDRPNEFPAISPMTIPRVMSLLRLAQSHRPPQRAPHRRSGRNKPKNP